jgi:hypothetical protein
MRLCPVPDEWIKDLPFIIIKELNEEFNGNKY